jgi:predicted AlkP superfamily pyrophosphatase or phosphodiesterase
MPPLVLINAVGLTPRLLPHAPHLSALARNSWVRRLREVLPAVTCTAQASMLTGKRPAQHGIVANGWLFRDTMEVRFWQQSNRLIQAEPLYVTAKRNAAEMGRAFACAKLFWWFNQGADVAISVTPKPHYGVDGGKVFGVTGTPAGVSEDLEKQLGPFPFHTFWGPMAGLRCSEWIAAASALVLLDDRPDLTLVYLPHLDYDPQRFGPQGCDMPKLVRELDEACAPLLDAAKVIGAQVWVVSEYGHCQVSRAVYLNRTLRELNLLKVRPGPFGEQLDLYGSDAVAVCDHQLAHVYIPNGEIIPDVRNLLAAVPGIARVLAEEERAEIGLNHSRAGELLLLAAPDAWFAYPFWLDDRLAPDYARTVAIHHKPGYDPCELFLDPKLRFPKGRIAVRLLQKALGFRMKLDVIPLDAGLVRGSHGLAAQDPQDRPLLIGSGPPPGENLPMTAVRDLVLQALGLMHESRQGSA